MFVNVNVTYERPAAAAASSSSSSTPPPPSSRPRGSEDGDWVYVVWKFRGGEHASERGVHTGGRRAWEHLLGLLPSRRYPGSGASLRRAESLEEGQELYEREAQRHKAPLPAPVHEH